jgi:DNA-binding CsgD family transcriptional regulator
MGRASPKRKSPRLPKALINQLGKRPDQQLADAFDVPVEQVRRERLLRNAPRPRKPGVWTEQELALLGTAPDAKIAERVGVTTTAVKQQRRRLGIAAWGTTTEQRRHKWTKRQLGWLGKLSDKEIASRLGLSIPTVCWKRQLLGIEPLKASGRGRQWTEKEIALLGTLPDTEVARRIGVHRHRVALKRRQLGIPSAVAEKNKQRWTPERIAKLGKVPDREIAQQMGISAGIVTAYRHRHQIPLRCERRRSPRGGHRVHWQRQHIERLGTVPDRVLAQELGITPQAVAQLRQRLGIPACHARAQ